MEEEEESLAPFDVELSKWMAQDSYILRPYEGPIGPRDLPSYMPDSPGGENVQVLPPPRDIILPEQIQNRPLPKDPMKVKLLSTIDEREKKQTFAMTPLDKGYYEPEEQPVQQRKRFDNILIKHIVNICYFMTSNIITISINIKGFHRI